MSSEDTVVRARELTKQFGNLTVLRSLSVSLQKGESLAIFGRNGAGKTTLLKIIAGLVRSYRGEVTVFGAALKDSGNGWRRRIGFVSHDTFLYPDLTVRDNLIFHARLYHVPDASRSLDRVIEEMGLEAKAAVPVRTLSRGMKQRLSICRALLHGPELLVLDEPFTGLDDRAVDVLDKALLKMKSLGGSVLMTSHDIARGWRHADRVAVLDRGVIAYEVRAANTSQEQFRAAYREILSH